MDNNAINTRILFYVENDFHLKVISAPMWLKCDIIYSGYVLQVYHANNSLLYGNIPQQKSLGFLCQSWPHQRRLLRKDKKRK